MYERFEQLCRERGISVARFCRDTGMARSTISDWKSGKFKLKEDKRKVIANYFSVSLAWLDGETDMRQQTQPVFDLSAGNGRTNSQYACEYQDMGDGSDEEHSWCRIYGNSMFPVLHDGDMVKVHHQTQTEPSDLTVIKIDGESATCKYVEVVDNGVWLRAENKDEFEDRFYTVQDVLTLPIAIIGKVVEMRRDFR